jgi:hypothetical protein
MTRIILISVMVGLLSIPIYLLRAEEMNEADKWVNEALSDQKLTKEEIKGTIEKYDLSGLFTYTESSFIFGFIGDNFQRIHIHFAKARKDEKDPNQYQVEGKTKVKNNICDFKGTITIISGRKQAKEKIIDDILDRDEKVASSIAIRGVAVSNCEFRENPNQKYVGIFKGKLTTYFYIDLRGIIHYDDLNNYRDAYFNNGFVGVWTSYNGKLVKKVHWGDWRIPFSGDLDVGAGEFHPAKKYLNNGWEFFKDERNVVKKGPDGKWYRQRESEWWK